jgi:prepilin peptidase CpaA
LALLLFILLVALYARGMMGGGDVKLAAATALGLSPGSQYGFVVVTALAGGVLALLHLVLRRALRGARARPPPRGAGVFQRVLAAERWRIARRGSLPYGVAIACGGIWAVLAGRGG